MSHEPAASEREEELDAVFRYTTNSQLVEERGQEGVDRRWPADVVDNDEGVSRTTRPGCFGELCKRRRADRCPQCCADQFAL